jgi:hypothetical protein
VKNPWSGYLTGPGFSASTGPVTTRPTNAAQAWARCTVEICHARTVLATQRLDHVERLQWQAWIEKLLDIRAHCDA